MRVFGTYQQLKRTNNRVLSLFFAAIAIVTLVFVGIVAVHYLLGWW
jgi:hypothetical protein